MNGNEQSGTQLRPVQTHRRMLGVRIPVTVIASLREDSKTHKKSQESIVSAVLTKHFELRGKSRGHLYRTLETQKLGRRTC